jgi:hypothetical protein
MTFVPVRDYQVFAERVETLWAPVEVEAAWKVAY